MLDKLVHAKRFSKMHSKTGFHQISIILEDIDKMEITTRYRLFEFLVLSMGLSNAPVTFQSFMNAVLFDFIDMFMVVYIGDIIIFSTNEAEHLKHLELFYKGLMHINSTLVVEVRIHERPRRISWPQGIDKWNLNR